MKNYRYLRQTSCVRRGEIRQFDSEAPATQRLILAGVIEPLASTNKGLRLRVCEYQKRILSGKVKAGEVVFMRGVKPQTICRIVKKSPDFANAYLIKLPGGKSTYLVDFDPIDWSEYWVDSGMKIQQWAQVDEMTVASIADGSYDNRPGAVEAARAEIARRRQGRRQGRGQGRGLRKEIEVFAKAANATRDIDDAMAYAAMKMPADMLRGKRPTGKNGLIFTNERERMRRLDREDARQRIAKRLGISNRNVSDDLVNHEIAVRAAAQATARLSEERRIPNVRMGRQMRDADIMGFLSNRFNLFNDPDINHAHHEASLFVLFGAAEVEVTFGVNLDRGGWQWSSGERENVWSTTLAMACDDFEAWVREQFVEPAPPAPRPKVTRHIGTADMGGRGTGGHR